MFTLDPNRMGVNMTTKFVAEAITQTAGAADNKRIEITLTDNRGRLQTISFNLDVARVLARQFAEFEGKESSEGPVATKMPEDFAVGTGRFEDVVLVKFENDIPYGLRATQAAALGRALVEQAKLTAAAPRRGRQ